ncbi:BMP family lipoprotein [Acholeplasma hippikon]|uniref:Purine nucleoside receptor A n=1 Tax=Acholeplasma hippikon TaxID=264636 RepID=A0A449BI51_9MOLU|nr:BMP family ABC transporter substrate-binding protein [Acholeplasma hippikon]VEU82093.1 Purine nucleoside receptor A [Acholeplasma hippikon]
MKKLFALLFVLVAGFVLVSCGNQAKEIAMITDTGDIDDGSFNEGTWKGIQKYAEEHNKKAQYYKPGGETTGDYLAAIDLAVAGGAKIVITPGFYFEVPVFQAQTKYPDVKFVILDGAPHSGDYNNVINENTLSIFFKEEESGFLAGYATYLDGKTKLGFMGGIAVPAVQRFGIGWVAGAYYAAKEKGDANYAYDPANYTYLGDFGPKAEFATMAGTWYDRGVEAIHAAAGGAGLSVMSAATSRTNKWVIGVDSYQSGDSNTVLSSAVKGVGTAAYEALEDFYNGTFQGGKSITLGAKEDAVGLPMATSRFTSFNEAKYDEIFGKVKSTLAVPNDAAKLKTFIEGLGYTFPEGLSEAIAG